MIHVVLYQPEIPQNTGNVGRLCAYTQSRLHLIHPLGFEITDRNLRRAGMDYWYSLDVHEHESWDAFLASDVAPERLWLFTTRGRLEHWDVDFHDGDGLVFGRETAGVPDDVHRWFGAERSVTLRKYDSALRSLNLATSVGIATYEALRQLRG